MNSKTDGSVVITLDLYSHVVPGMQEAAALAVDKWLAIGRNSAAK